MLMNNPHRHVIICAFIMSLLFGCQTVPTFSQAEIENAINQQPPLYVASAHNKKCQIASSQFEGSYIATGDLPHYLYNTDLFHSHRYDVHSTLAKHQYDMWDKLAANLTMPVPNNRRIRYYRKWFINKPEHVVTVTERAKPFLFYIYEQVEARNLPTEIALLPFIESSFDQYAYSNQGAAGLWQITRPTGKTFGLKYWQGYDGRRDIVTSTQAALDLLEYLHAKFNGNWLHAIAAYNTGEGRVRNAIKKNKAAGKPTDFWSLQLPKETRLYVPKLLAMSSIIKHPNNYGLTLKTIAPTPVVNEVVVNKRVKLKQIAKDAGVDSKILYALNPGYTGGYTVKGRDNQLLLPRQALATFFNSKGTRYTKHRYQIHKIKAGDSLYEIAQLNNTTVTLLRQLNDLPSSFITAGQQLIVPITTN